jgi:hypothetical protein
MTSLTEIQAAAEALPPEQKEQLMHFLAELLLEQRTNHSRSVPLSYSKRGFPISRGRTAFTDGDVAQIDLETELSR